MVIDEILVTGGSGFVGSRVLVQLLAVAGETLSMLEVANILRSRMGAAARKVPKRELPDWLLRIVGVFDTDIRSALPQLGVVRHAGNEKAKRVLGWNPRSNEEAIVGTAESLVRLGLV